MATITYKKRRERSRVTMSATPSSCIGLYIKDNTTGIQYLVDTDTFCSGYPATSRDTNIIDTDPLLLTATTGTTIPTLGTRDIQLHINGRKYTWTFWLTEVTQPFLGANFRGHDNLLLDIARHRLVETDSFNTHDCIPALLSSAQLSSTHQHLLVIPLVLRLLHHQML